MKNIAKHLVTNMEAEDVKDLIASLNVIVNEKIKAASAKKGKKKAPAKKATTKTAATFEDMVDDEYDGFL